MINLSYNTNKSTRTKSTLSHTMIHYDSNIGGVSGM